MMKIKIALDWTPNTLHAGILLAEAEGYFKDKGLEVEMISPEEDNYAVTAPEKLAQKQVHIAIGPSESVIDFNTRGDKSVPLLAIATLLQRETSAFVTLRDSSIKRPSQLDNATIGVYGMRFESDIIRQLIIRDGGKGEFTARQPARLEMWQHVVNRSIDATWIFLPWEGVKAQYKDKVAFNTFLLRDFGIPYGYAPVLMSHQDFVRDENQALKAFLQAVEQGWRDVHDNPEKAARHLHEYVKHPDFQEIVIIRKSLEQIAPALLRDNNQWGFMEGYHWVDFIDWMIDCQVLKDREGIPMNHGQIDTSMLYTNDFFK